MTWTKVCRIKFVLSFLRCVGNRNFKFNPLSLCVLNWIHPSTYYHIYKKLMILSKVHNPPLRIYIRQRRWGWSRINWFPCKWNCTQNARNSRVVYLNPWLYWFIPTNTAHNNCLNNSWMFKEIISFQWMWCQWGWECLPHAQFIVSWAWRSSFSLWFSVSVSVSV